MEQASTLETVAWNGPIGPQSAKAGAHIGSFDILRVVAAAAIVWIHAIESDSLRNTVVWCRFAVPAFTAVSVFLMASSLKEKSIAGVLRYAAKRAWGIYRLFLIWNVIYLLARLVQHSFLSEGHALRFGVPSLLIVGMESHLWYLPFLSFMAIALALPVRGFIRLDLLPALGVTVLLALAGLWAAHLATVTRLDIERPLTIFSFLALSALPSALWAFPIAWVWNRWGNLGCYFVHAVFSLALAGLCLYVSMHSSQPNLWHNIAGILVLLAALCCAGAMLGDFARILGELALPVYLVHCLVIDGCHVIGRRFRIGPSGVYDLVVYVTAICGSLLIAYVISRNRRLFWMLTTRPTQQPRDRQPHHSE